MDRDARLRTARLSPEIANRHDRDAWLALYTDDAVVEDPVGTPACRGKDLRRFYAAFIAQTSIRIEERLDVVVRDTVVRDVVLHVTLPGGGRAEIPAFLEYDLDPSGERVRRMRAYWDARRNGRAMMAQGARGKLTSALSVVRILRHFGGAWTKRYFEGTRRGIRRDGPALFERFVRALGSGDRGAIAAMATPDATLELSGEAPRPLAEASALPIEASAPICAGFTCVARCRTDGGLEGIAFVEVDPASKRIARARLLWEPLG
jgi:hypothetical protein